MFVTNLKSIKFITNRTTIHGVSKLCDRNVKICRGVLCKHLLHSGTEMQYTDSRKHCWMPQMNALWWLKSPFSARISSNMYYYINVELHDMQFMYKITQGKGLALKDLYWTIPGWDSAGSLNIWASSLGVVREWIVLCFHAWWSHEDVTVRYRRIPSMEKAELRTVEFNRLKSYLTCAWCELFPCLAPYIKCMSRSSIWL